MPPILKNKLPQKHKSLQGRIIFILLGLLSLSIAIYLIFFYNYKAYKRQDLEESLADDYIDYLIKNADKLEKGQEETEPSADIKTSSDDIINNTDYGNSTDSDRYQGSGKDGQKETVPESSRDKDTLYLGYDDDNYYERDGVTYTPDYAQGSLMCVLEYPAVKIRRGVYTGTWEDIYVDLDHWMATAAHPKMRLGQTHLSIYGHNHTSQNLSFNNLKNAKIGDTFTLYADSGVYTYTVTDIFSDWRTDVTNRYVENFNIDKDICYIITCGRDNFLINGQSTRYKDFIIQGQLKSHKALSEYAEEVLN